VFGCPHRALSRESAPDNESHPIHSTQEFFGSGDKNYFNVYKLFFGAFRIYPIYRYASKRSGDAESGATRTPIPAQGGQQSGDCGQQVMAA
jgi:hypothetical protein